MKGLVVGIPVLLILLVGLLVNGLVVGIPVFDLVASLVVGNADFDLVRETEVVRETVLVNGIVVGIPVFDLVRVGDLVLETVILVVLVDKRVVAKADRLGVLVTEIV